MKKFCLAVAFLAMFLAARPALCAAMQAGDIQVLSPARGLRVDVVSSDGGDMSAVVVDYVGPGLPGRDSIIIGFDDPPAERVHASAIISGDRHWAVPKWPRSLSGLPQLTLYAVWERPQGGYCTRNKNLLVNPG